MVEEMGEVVAVDNGWITVQTQIKSTCNACHANDDCGTGIVARALAPKVEALRFKTDLPVSVGSRVRLGIQEDALLSASFMLYMLPLIILIISVMLFSHLLPMFQLEHEGWVLLATVLTCLFSFSRLSRHLKQREQQHYQPQLLGVVLDPPSQGNIS
ncbi:SoxR reducing system RseC family protein [Alteromonas facilis]|uniref:SoxR reducing system RseC family protein n=1 Tax=Alteromonas facilis TaxID=2048004 RepID=UPI000C2938C6|nr:SoxR reducing system RseC family protein [Alteromonas facilis]